MAAKYNIQSATAKDVQGIARVHIDTWRTTYKGIVPDAYLDSLNYEKRESFWDSVIAENNPKHHLWIAKDDHGEVFGFSNGGNCRDHSLPFDGEIYALYLRKEFQGQGIGKRLFVNSFEQLFRHGFTKVVVWVLEDNPTRTFYAAMGGEPVSEKWENISGKRLKEIAYGWPDIRAALQKLRLCVSQV